MSPRNERMGIVSGIFLLIGLHIAAVILGIIILLIHFYLVGQDNYLTLLLFGSFFAGLGIVQLIYVIPAIIVLRRRRELALLKGLIIGAVVTALLNGGCWLLMYRR
jgi:uncharacterized membrane protein